MKEKVAAVQRSSFLFHRSDWDGGSGCVADGRTESAPSEAADRTRRSWRGRI